MKLNEVANPVVDWNSKTEKQQITMVRRNGAAIQKIDNPSEAVCWAAVENCKWAIQFIKDPSEALQLAVVKQDGWAVEYIKNPSEAVQLVAVKRYGPTILKIKHPNSLVIKTALTDQRLIEMESEFKQVVEQLFKDNALLMKKWLRYGEAMRNINT